MKPALFSLVGHQPLPTLMVIRHLKPSVVVLLGTNARELKLRRKNLKAIIDADAKAGGDGHVEVIEPPDVDAWNMESIIQRVGDVCTKYDLEHDNVVFDVTGGTKAMSISLAQVAKDRGSELVYLDSDDFHVRLWRYRFEDSPPPAGKSKLELVGGEPTRLGELLEIKDLIRAYLGDVGYPARAVDTRQEGYWFARDVHRGFQSLQGQPRIDESRERVYISAKEEVDIILRSQNRFALVECKWVQDPAKDPKMEGVYQLNNAASERYLGTYTAKIWAVRTRCNRDTREVADAHLVNILELPEWQCCGEIGYQWSESELDGFRRVLASAFRLS